MQRRACYLAMAIGMDGEREVLGMWSQTKTRDWTKALLAFKIQVGDRLPD